MNRENASQKTGTSEMRDMTTASEISEEASFKLSAIAMPANWSDTRAASLMRAAARLKISPSRAKKILYRECKRIYGEEIDNIRAAYARLEARAEQAADLQLERARLAQEAFHASTTDESGAAIGMDSREDSERS